MKEGKIVGPEKEISENSLFYRWSNFHWQVSGLRLFASSKASSQERI
jgi:hypothetical protein